jgi:hypothetical protein
VTLRQLAPETSRLPGHNAAGHGAQQAMPIRRTRQEMTGPRSSKRVRAQLAPRIPDTATLPECSGHSNPATAAVTANGSIATPGA